MIAYQLTELLIYENKVIPEENTKNHFLSWTEISA